METMCQRDNNQYSLLFVIVSSRIQVAIHAWLSKFRGTQMLIINTIKMVMYLKVNNAHVQI